MIKPPHSSGFDLDDRRFFRPRVDHPGFAGFDVFLMDARRDTPAGVRSHSDCGDPARVFIGAGASRPCTGRDFVLCRVAPRRTGIRRLRLFLRCSTADANWPICYRSFPGRSKALRRSWGFRTPCPRSRASLMTVLAPSLFGQAAGFGYTLFGGLTNLLLLVVAAIYLAFDPKLYRKLFASLFPPAQRRGVETVMLQTGTALKKWFVGQMVSMLFGRPSSRVLVIGQSVCRHQLRWD